MSESSKGDKNSMYSDKWYRSEEGKKEFKKKMSIKLKGIPRTEEVKKKISESLKHKPKTEEFKKSVSEGMKKVWNDRKKNGIIIKRNHSGKHILKLDLKGNIIEEFESIKKAAIDANMDREMLKNKIKLKSIINNYIYKFK